MKSFTSPDHDRRSFLRFLAGSPYIAALGGIRAFAQRAPEIAEVITDPKEAFNVMDFEVDANQQSCDTEAGNLRTNIGTED